MAKSTVHGPLDLTKLGCLGSTKMPESQTSEKLSEKKQWKRDPEGFKKGCIGSSQILKGLARDSYGSHASDSRVKTLGPYCRDCKKASPRKGAECKSTCPGALQLVLDLPNCKQNGQRIASSAESFTTLDITHCVRK